MKGENKNNNEFLKRLGISAESLVKNPVVDFLVSRYVNWSTESQKLFRRVFGVFVLGTFIAVILLMVLGSYEKHQKIHQHTVIYQLLKKYSVKKTRQEEQLAFLQAGKGGIARRFSKRNLDSILKKQGLPADVFSVNELESEKQENFVRKAFEVNVNQLTYPQLTNTLFVLESLGTNVQISKLKITHEGQEKGFYATLFTVSVTEPVAEKKP